MPLMITDANQATAARTVRCAPTRNTAMATTKGIEVTQLGVSSETTMATYDATVSGAATPARCGLGGSLECAAHDEARRDHDHRDAVVPRCVVEEYRDGVGEHLETRHREDDGGEAPRRAPTTRHLREPTVRGRGDRLRRLIST